MRIELRFKTENLQNHDAGLGIVWVATKCEGIDVKREDHPQVFEWRHGRIAAAYVLLRLMAQSLQSEIERIDLEPDSPSQTAYNLITHRPQWVQTMFGRQFRDVVRLGIENGQRFLQPTSPHTVTVFLDGRKCRDVASIQPIANNLLRQFKGWRGILGHPELMELVLPYRLSERHLLQVLVNEFNISRIPCVRDSYRYALRLRFDDETPTIFRRDAKEWLKELQDKQTAAELQETLDEFFDGQSSDLHINEDDFYFRYSNGGTLPVVTMPDGRDYFALFYRDEFPVGWNIANGGSDSCRELFHPQETIEREFIEELIVVDVVEQCRYRLQSELELPEFVESWRLWGMTKGWSDFDDQVLPGRWIEQEDIMDEVHINDEVPPIRNVLINITATDFGIELDRVFKLDFSKEQNADFSDDGTIVNTPIRLVDGELRNGEVLGRPIGLFHVDRFKKEDLDGEFEPDYTYYDGELRFFGPNYSVRKLVANEFVPRLIGLNLRLVNHDPQEYGLCPITKNVIKMWLSRNTIFSH